MIEWEELLYATAERFDGALPHPETAAELAAAYARAPHAVLKAIDRAATEYAEGAIRSPWGILRTRVKDLKATTAAAERVQDRETTVARAEQWIRNAGIHLDWDEVEAELFAPPAHTPPAEWLIELERTTRDQPGRPIYNSLLKAAIVRTMNTGTQPVPNSAGRLHQHDTPDVRKRMRDLWEQLRPLGELAEHEANERGARYAQQRATINATPTPNETTEQQTARRKHLAATKGADTTPLTR